MIHTRVLHLHSYYLIGALRWPYPTFCDGIRNFLLYSSRWPGMLGWRSYGRSWMDFLFFYYFSQIFYFLLNFNSIWFLFSWLLIILFYFEFFLITSIKFDSIQFFLEFAPYYFDLFYFLLNFFYYFFISIIWVYFIFQFSPYSFNF
jgi:hypothetical protein